MNARAVGADTCEGDGTGTLVGSGVGLLVDRTTPREFGSATTEIPRSELIAASSAALSARSASMEAARLDGSLPLVSASDTTMSNVRVQI